MSGLGPSPQQRGQLLKLDKHAGQRRQRSTSRAERENKDIHRVGWLFFFFKPTMIPSMYFLGKCKLFIHSLGHHSEKQVPVCVKGRQKAPPALPLAKALGRTGENASFASARIPHHAVPWSTGGPQRQGRARGRGSLKCFQELCPAVCPSRPGVPHKATRTLMRLGICCHSLGKTWLAVWPPGFENVSLTPWSNSCSSAWRTPGA